MSAIIKITVSILLLFMAFIAPILAQEEPICQQEATVQVNDWLSKIAEKSYGDALAYPAIVRATNQKHNADESFAIIENPDIIEPGWKLCLPTAEIALGLLQDSSLNKAVTGPVGRLILATTTSTENSGLLAYILPQFESQYQADVDVIAVGTGQAIELGRRGDADVILVHARSREDAFVQQGNGINRQDVMYNDFVILGPANDPAGIAGMTDAALALTQIAASQSPFVSRGDESGTHSKELSLWAEADIAPDGSWYISAGQGMGAVLSLADELQAYTLSDRGTYLARTLEGLDLTVLVQGDSQLFNPYGVIAVNPLNHPGVNYNGATLFINWLTSLETQEMISQFGVAEFGQSLFVPNSQAWGETGN